MVERDLYQMASLAGLEVQKQLQAALTDIIWYTLYDRPDRQHPPGE